MCTYILAGRVITPEALVRVPARTTRSGVQSHKFSYGNWNSVVGLVCAETRNKSSAYHATPCSKLKLCIALFILDFPT